MWLPYRLSKRQSLSTTTVLFRTTFTRTIKLNLLLDLFKLVISFVLGSFKWTAEMKSYLPLNFVFQYINFAVNLWIYFSLFLLFSQTHPVTLQQPQDFCSTDFLVFCVFCFLFGILLINPLSPSVHIQILQTGLYAFLKELVERIWQKIKTFSLWWSFYQFS